MSSEEFTEVKFEDHPVEGSLDHSSMDADDGTLNEPVSETIKRDLTAVFNKFKIVVYPNRVVRPKKIKKRKTSTIYLKSSTIVGLGSLGSATPLHHHGPASTNNFRRT